MFNIKSLTVSLFIGYISLYSFSEQLKVELVNTGNRDWFYPGEETSFKLRVTNLSIEPIGDLRELGIKIFHEGKLLPGMDGYTTGKLMQPPPKAPEITFNEDGTWNTKYTPPVVNWLHPNDSRDYPVELGLFRLGNKLEKLQIEAIYAPELRGNSDEIKLKIKDKR